MEIALQLATLISVLLAAASIFHGAFINRRQMNAQVFLEYTRRYEAVMEAFPEEARSFRLKPEGDPPPESPALSHAVLRYINLCSEEYYLCKKRYLDREIWQIWERELKKTLCSPLMKREWKKLRGEFTTFSEFAAYVADLQEKSNRSQTTDDVTITIPALSRSQS